MAAKDLQISLSRKLNGKLYLKVVASPVVEEFMQSISANQKYPVLDVSSSWAPVDRAPADFQYYVTPGYFNAEMLGNGIRIDNIGGRLTSRNDRNVELVNLSFLTLTGISQPDGVTIELRDMLLSQDGLLQLRDTLVRATKRLFVQYIKSVEAVGVLTQTSEIIT